MHLLLSRNRCQGYEGGRGISPHFEDRYLATASDVRKDWEGAKQLLDGFDSHPPLDYIRWDVCEIAVSLSNPKLHVIEHKHCDILYPKASRLTTCESILFRLANIVSYF